MVVNKHDPRLSKSPLIAVGKHFNTRSSAYGQFNPTQPRYKHSWPCLYTGVHAHSRVFDRASFKKNIEHVEYAYSGSKIKFYQKILIVANILVSGILGNHVDQSPRHRARTFDRKRKRKPDVHRGVRCAGRHSDEWKFRENSVGGHQQLRRCSGSSPASSCWFTYYIEQ
uniref:Uncharacterized protein n=1 Tax=Anopheles atroparvus TaxID=41427 RepID=A0AAG5DQY7_ANOAO